jgi:hypothetical protein
LSCKARRFARSAERIPLIGAPEAEMSEEVSRFHDQITKPHRRVSPCFMTGKGCVYTEQIDRDIERRKQRKEGQGFAVMSFKPNSSVFFELCMKRYVGGAYSMQSEGGGKESPSGSSMGSLTLIRADQVRRTGYVICEKICKKIQESDFIIVDISVPNANVFYEMGLAFGIDQKMVLIRHADSQFGQEVERYLSTASCKAYSYANLSPLSLDHFPLSSYIWRRNGQSMIDPSPTMLLLDDLEGFNGQPEAREESSRPMDIPLRFPDHVRAAVGVAIDNISARLQDQDESVKVPEAYYPLIRSLRVTMEVPRNSTFKDIMERVEQSFCTIIRTGGKSCNPMMYFWLGYCHARGKNVIPISILKNQADDIDDLAFDIRALWHMSFLEDRPSILAGELEETLHQMIISDFAEWSRRRFWDEILGKRGKVSIFTGALHNPIGREMIGDWDLRAASELTSYFASHQYRATIESPVYQIEQVEHQVGREEYISELEEMLRGKNCVIIASPDVNPLSEMVLGRIYGISKSHWFRSDQNFDAKRIPHAVIAFKGTARDNDDASSLAQVRRLFYQESPEMSHDKRGFQASFLADGKIIGGFVSQTEKPGGFKVHAHLAVVPNPFCDPEERKYIVILNGVSGPATFAMTHILTGGVSHEFVAYDPKFNPNTESESILKKILEEMNIAKASRVRNTGHQFIVEVEVGVPKSRELQGQATGRAIFDWRHICHWRLVEKDSFDLRREG